MILGISILIQVEKLLSGGITEIVPLYVSIMSLTIFSPKPVPVSFSSLAASNPTGVDVVKNALKILSLFSSGIPLPLSVNSKYILLFSSPQIIAIFP